MKQKENDWLMAMGGLLLTVLILMGVASFYEQKEVENLEDIGATNTADDLIFQVSNIKYPCPIVTINWDQIKVYEDQDDCDKFEIIQMRTLVVAVKNFIVEYQIEWNRKHMK